MSKKLSITQLLMLVYCYTSLVSNAQAQNNSIEELFLEANCHVKEGMHASHDYTKNEMFSGGINNGYVGQTSLKVGFVHTKNDKGGFDTKTSYAWTKSPVDGQSTKSDYPDPLDSRVILVEDYFSFISHSQTVSLSRTYKDNWHGILIDLGGSEDRSSAFVYPLKCKFDNSIDGPLDLLNFRYKTILKNRAE